VSGEQFVMIISMTHQPQLFAALSISRTLYTFVTLYFSDLRTS